MIDDWRIFGRDLIDKSSCRLCDAALGFGLRKAPSANVFPDLEADTGGLLSLTLDVLDVQIFGRLAYQDLVHLSQCSRSYNLIVTNNIWRVHAQRRFVGLGLLRRSLFSFSDAFSFKYSEMDFKRLIQDYALLTLAPNVDRNADRMHQLGLRWFFEVRLFGLLSILIFTNASFYYQSEF